MIGALIAAWLDVRSKPLRTLAAIAGMVAAVTAVVMVDAASILSQAASDEFIVSTYGRTATISVQSPEQPVIERDDPAAPSGFIATLQNNGIDRVSVDMDVGGVLVRGDFVTSTNARWVSSTYPSVSVVGVNSEMYPQQTANSRALHIIISPEIASSLGFKGDEAIGQVVMFSPGFEASREDLRVLQLQPVVIDAVSSDLGIGNDGRNVLIVSDIYQPDLAMGRGMRWIVHVDPSDISLTMNLIGNYSWGQSNEDAPLISQRVDQGDNLKPLLSQQAVTARVVSIVALAVGGLGILGVGVASVRERSQEFGLRRAIGANTRIVFFGVIAQTLIEVMIAATIGVVLAAILIRVFARKLVLGSLPLPESTNIPLDSALTGVASALVVGLLAGLIPAIRASRASIVTALQG